MTRLQSRLLQMTEGATKSESSPLWWPTPVSSCEASGAAAFSASPSDKIPN